MSAKVVIFEPLKTGLPQNLEAEKFLLGSIVLDGEVFQGVADGINPDDFSTDRHQVIFRHMANIAESGHRIDRTTLMESLMNSGKLEEAAYSVELDTGIPAHINLDGYIRIVKEKSIKRSGIMRCNSAMLRFAGEEPSETVIAAWERDAQELGANAAGDSGFVQPREVIEAAGGIQDYLARRKANGVQTPWGELNKLTGGLKRGHLWIVAALTSRGKTAFALNIAKQAAVDGVGVAIFSHEMEADELTDRFLTLETKRDKWQLSQPQFSRDVLAGANTVCDMPIWIDDHNTATVPAMEARVRKLQRRASIGLVVVDYLQLVSGTGKAENRQIEVSSVSRGLKRMAKKLGVPVLALSQLSRKAGDGEREPELSDLRESGSIEQDANLAGFLHFTRMWDMSPEIMDPWGELSFLVKKHRGGAIGKIPMRFHAPTGLFAEFGGIQ